MKKTKIVVPAERSGAALTFSAPFIGAAQGKRMEACDINHSKTLFRCSL